MRRFLKISGIVTGSFIVILLVLSFSVYIGDHKENGRNEDMYVDLLRMAIPFSAEDSIDLDFRHVCDSPWQSLIVGYFNPDSDMQAYIADPDGTPLALSEMKICPLLGRHNVNDSYYRAYWAKNLYWFFCWEETGYDKETDISPGGRMVYLVPEENPRLRIPKI